MVSNIKNKLKSLEKAKETAVKVSEEGKKFESSLDGDEDLESTFLNSQQQSLLSRANDELNVRYGFIKSIRPRRDGDQITTRIDRMVEDLSTYTGERKRTIDGRSKSSLASTAFRPHPVVSSKISWSIDENVPEKLYWKVQFRCLKPLGHEESWVVLGFHPKKFREWWWKGRNEVVDKGSNIWEDIRTLARKVFYMTTYIENETMERSLNLTQLKRIVEKAKESTMTIEHLVRCYTTKSDRIRAIFEILVPLAFVSSKTALNALEIAESDFCFNGALNSRIENHLQIIEILLGKTNGFLLSLHRELHVRPSRFLTISDNNQVKEQYSPTNVYSISDPLCLEEGLVTSIQEYKAFVTRVELEDTSPSGRESAIPVNDDEEHSDAKLYISLFEDLEIPRIDVVDDTSDWIGEGSFGEVFKMGLSTGLGACAVKRLIPRDGVENRLEREVKIWAGLKHTNILPLLGYTFIASSTLPALVSPLCLDNLKSYLNEHQTRMDNAIDKSSMLSELRRLQFIDDISRGLNHLHSKEVAHGDLRAVNVLVREDDECSSVYAVLCDFGTSKTTDRSAELHTTLRQRTNEAWLSPELMVSNENRCQVTKSGDIWAFGCIFLEVQYGTSPFENVDYAPAELLLSKSLPATKDRLVGLRDSHWGLMTRCWKFLPDERPNMPRISLEVKKLIKEVSSP